MWRKGRKTKNQNPLPDLLGESESLTTLAMVGDKFRTDKLKASVHFKLIFLKLLSFNPSNLCDNFKNVQLIGKSIKNMISIML